MIRVVVAAAEQSVAYDLRAALDEMDGVELDFVVESTGEVAGAVTRLDPDVVLVHDRLGPEPALQAVRDLALRRPTCAALLVTATPGTDVLTAAMEAGARGVVGLPLTFEALQARVAAAGDWSRMMRRLVADPHTSPVRGGEGRGRVVTLAGAKGGVGVTTIATHLAIDVVRSTPGHRVCLVDLDLEKGDVTGLLELRHRASIADVAKVSEDLSARAVADAVVVHESGLHLLLTPADVRDVESVTPRALREVLAVLRQEYDLVVVDAGSHVTPAQAAVVELTDELVAVTTPDVLAMRGLRRAITTWESLGVRKESEVRVLVNRLSRQAAVSAETVRQLTRAPVLGLALPAMFRRLEPALNSRDPLTVRDDVWWRTMRAIGQELGLTRTPPRRHTAAIEPGRRRGLRARTGRERGDRGSISVEMVGVLPAVLLVAVLVWQAVLYGLTLSWSGHAANVAAHALSVHEAPGPAARAAVPGGVAAGMTVTPEGPGGDTVTVSLRVPLVAPGVADLPARVTVTRQVVVEPSP